MWGLIDYDLFSSVAETLEDVMRALVPGVIENVRVAEIKQGNDPFPLISNFVNYVIGNIIPFEIIGSFSDTYWPLLQPSMLHQINDS